VVLLVRGSRVRMPGRGGKVRREWSFWRGSVERLAAALFGSVDGVVAAYGRWGGQELLAGCWKQPW
jgi:hypothetical protein